ARLLSGSDPARPIPDPMGQVLGGSPDCPVCAGARADALCSLDGRDYWRCGRCRATFVAPDQLPDAATELAHYRLHRNHPDDPGYRAFLGRLAEPLLARLAPGA